VPGLERSGAEAGWSAMTVYVDDSFVSVRMGRGSASWCRLTADSRAELHSFAADLSMPRHWFRNQPVFHYEVSAAVRRRAIGAGAVAVSSAELPAIARAAGEGAPAEALAGGDR
jgi:Protein of unknown function (DUF4031)